MADTAESVAPCSISEQSGLIVWNEHADFLVAYKPAGLSFHSEDGNSGFVVQVKAVCNEPGLHAVHRLDRITSGLVLFARHADAARNFGQMFEDGHIEKYYLTLSDRKPAKKQGAIKGAMAKGRGGNWRFVTEGGVQAHTQFFSYATGAGQRLFILRPRTGRTHQLRVALKSLGAPILGDTRYGGSPADRGYLHAWALRFRWRDRLFEFVLPPQEGEQFTSAAVTAQLNVLGTPWKLVWPGNTSL